jgi:hypothetical protein
MKRIAFIAAAVLTVTSPVFGQGFTRTINLTAEQRHIIKEIVLKEQNVTKADANLPISVGDVLPANVATYPFPAELGERVPQVKSHVFLVRGNEVIVVDPRDRTVQEVID